MSDIVTGIVAVLVLSIVLATVGNLVTKKLLLSSLMSILVVATFFEILYLMEVENFELSSLVGLALVMLFAGIVNLAVWGIVHAFRRKLYQSTEPTLAPSQQTPADTGAPLPPPPVSTTM